jgi:hypothetical protein
MCGLIYIEQYNTHTTAKIDATETTVNADATYDTLQPILTGLIQVYYM